MSTELVRYDAMCQAIAEVHRIDEVKDMRDKAQALESYARQAQNKEAEQQCREIRLRAERRTGELIRQQQEAGDLATRGDFHGNQHAPGVSSETTHQTLSGLGISRDQSSKWQQLADIPDETFEQEVRQPDASTASMLRNHNHRAQGSGVNEWYTPETYIIAARDVMGGIDLDPATSDVANEQVRAECIFTEDDNGLESDWHGRVWLNPPYSQPAIAHFANKVVAEYRCGNVDAAIVLTHNYTDTAWFHTLAKASTAICFTRGRIAFEAPDGRKAAPTQGQAFFYFGPNVNTFVSVFKTIGFVVEVK